eukprot:scaffold30138_cov22-Tisochrysis_lutea.AAC.1
MDAAGVDGATRGAAEAQQDAWDGRSKSWALVRLCAGAAPSALEFLPVCRCQCHALGFPPAEDRSKLLKAVQ